MKKQLQFDWWKYLLLLVLPIVVWCNIFSMSAKPAEHERLQILYIGNGLDTQSLCRELETALPGLTQQKILAVSVEREDITPSQYSNTLTARCFDYDLIIIQESCMQDNVGQTVFVRLLPELTEQLPNLAPYEETAEDTLLTFGYVLYDGVRANRFWNFYTGEETCYVFISPESVNFDTLNEKGRIGDDAALKVLQYLSENVK